MTHPYITSQKRTGAADGTFVYDKLFWIKEETTGGTKRQYAYDHRGNRQTYSNASVSITSGYELKHDVMNRMSEYKDDKGKTIYTYYPNGLRASKQQTGSVTDATYYVYLNGQVIEELTQDGKSKARNIWGNRLIWRKDYTSNLEGTYYYNSHGDVVKIVGANGAVLNSYDYDIWGNPTTSKETMANPFLYAGEVYDKESGFYYLRARYYDPTGHWCESADGKWAHAGSCNDRSNKSRYEPDYKHDNDFIVENGVIKGVYEHVEGAREDIALEVNTFMLFAPLPKFLWGAKAAGAGKTAVTVWDTIKVTQAAVKGTNIPKSFVLSGLKAGGHEIWVHPNATKHMIDYMLKNERVINLSPQSKQMIEQAMLTSFRSAVEKAMPNLKPGRNFMTVGQWEIGINITEAEAVIYHALFR